MNEKMNKIVSVAVLMSLYMTTGYAMADEGHGNVHFSGAIVDAPCSIAPESVDQTIQLGQISNVVLEGASKEGPLRPFNIHLEGCSGVTAKTATVTFDGRADDVDKKHLAVEGYSKGAAIAMLNQLDGKEIVLGTPTSAAALVDGDNRLQFAAKVVSNLGAAETAVAGEFTATTNFVINYQ